MSSWYITIHIQCHSFCNFENHGPSYVSGKPSHSPILQPCNTFILQLIADFSEVNHHISGTVFPRSILFSITEQRLLTIPRLTRRRSRLPSPERPGIDRTNTTRRIHVEAVLRLAPQTARAQIGGVYQRVDERQHREEDRQQQNHQSVHPDDIEASLAQPIRRPPLVVEENQEQGTAYDEL